MPLRMWKRETVRYRELVKGNSKGCASCHQGTRNSNFRHGMVKSLTYRTWITMRSRCNNPKAKSYNRYGGRGIKVCSRWNIFNNFIEDMGERPAGFTIDRIDPNKGYEPDNCRWLTFEENLAYMHKLKSDKKLLCK